jgi:hypothetical protein
MINSNKKWSNDDIYTLIKNIKNKKTYNEISNIIGRSNNSIDMKLKNLLNDIDKDFNQEYFKFMYKKIKKNYQKLNKKYENNNHLLVILLKI